MLIYYVGDISSDGDVHGCPLGGKTENLPSWKKLYELIIYKKCIDDFLYTTRDDNYNPNHIEWLFFLFMYKKSAD